MIPGGGLLKGMAVTLKNFIATYPWGPGALRLVGIQSDNAMCTVEYPEQKVEHSERFRYFPFLVYDETPGNLRCVGCKICEQECPPQCIHIEMEKDAQGRPAKAHGRTYPAVFDIDVSVCMSCRICVDVCPFDAIEMDTQYELGAYDRMNTLVHSKARLLKSADYYARIHPTEAAIVNGRVEAKAQKAAAAAEATAAKAKAAAASPAPPTAPTPPPQPATPESADNNTPPPTEHA